MKFMRWIRHLAEAFLGICLLIMVLAVFGNVVLRYVWGTGWIVSEELARLLFIWLVSVAAILAFIDGKHLGFDMVATRLKGKTAWTLRWVARGLTAIALYHLIVGSWAQVWVGLDSRSPVMGYPLALTAAGTLCMGAAMAAWLIWGAWGDLKPSNNQGAQP